MEQRCRDDCLHAGCKLLHPNEEYRVYTGGKCLYGNNCRAGKHCPFAEDFGDDNMEPMILLVLIALPGAGKSTVCNMLHGFKRVNQDTVNNGKPGSRKQCVLLAKRYLRQRYNVIIDRCNFNAEQRSDWIKLAKEFKVYCWSLELKTDPEECIRRIEHRTMHEGGIDAESKKIKMIVYGTLSQMTPPTHDEGFHLLLSTPDQVGSEMQKLRQLKDDEIRCRDADRPETVSCFFCCQQ